VQYEQDADEDHDKTVQASKHHGHSEGVVWIYGWLQTFLILAFEVIGQLEAIVVLISGQIPSALSSQSAGWDPQAIWTCRKEF
jgi:hypothetical protein